MPVQLLPNKNESFAQYLKRLKYGIHRRLSPSLGRRHYLESLVGPIGHWDALQTYQFECLRNMGLEPHHHLLDIGCGPLQGGLKLIDYLEPDHYTGIDLQIEPIMAAYEQILEHQLLPKNPRLIISNSFGKHELQNCSFDFFWISQLLYHLSLDQIESLFIQAASTMTPTSLFYGDILDYRQESIQDCYWKAFKFYQHDPEELEAIANKAGLNLNILGQLMEYNYPTELELRHNYMLEISPKITPAVIPSHTESIALNI